MKHRQVQTAQTARPSDFIGLPYSPALLLNGRFGGSIVSSDDYVTGCKYGFESYFDEMWDENQDYRVCIDRFYTCEEVCTRVAEGVCDDADPLSEAAPLAWCVGFSLGWLSALSLSDLALAHQGLVTLHQCVDRLLREQQEVAA